MDLVEFKKKELPDQPGVYLFKAGSDILYIGKATSLKDRVKSYFSTDVIHARGPLIVDMVFKAYDIEYIETDSVLEALILEANLIKKHQPKYNTKEKDNKSYNYVVITQEDYPRVVTVRGRTLEQEYPHEDRKYTFGPFPQGGALKEALKIIRKIFPYRDKCIPWDELLEAKQARTRPCFNHQLGLCPGVCIGRMSKTEYGRTINHLRLFFEGKKATLLKSLEREMKGYAKARAFEKADKVKNQIFALNHIQDVSLLKKEKIESVERDYTAPEVVFRIEAYDIAHMSGGNTVGAMVVVEDGEMKNGDYRKFKIRHSTGVNDIAGLKEILRRRLKHTEWQLPSLIVVDGNVVQKQAAEEIISQFEHVIPVVAVTKNAAHKPDHIVGDPALVESHELAILLANSEAHRFAIGYHRKLRRKTHL